MKEFHEWAEEAYKTELVLVAEDGWNARQPEIDELKWMLKNANGQADDFCKNSIELQKRIDEALSAVWDDKCSHTVIDILKGNKND